MMRSLLSTVVGLRRVLLLAGVGALLLASSTPEGVGAAPSPSPKPSPSASSRAGASPSPTSFRSPSPSPSSSSKPKTKPTPPPGSVSIGKSPTNNNNNNSVTQRLAAATRAVDPAFLPVTNCMQVLAGTPPTCSFDLWAVPGTLSPGRVPGLTSSLPVWGFSRNGEGGQIPGPTLIISADQQLRIRLHNQLPAQAGNVSLEIPASTAAPDTVGIPRGAVTTYLFSGLTPGSYEYGAGSTPNAPRQVLMGLGGGLLIVRPHGYTAANTSAYGTQASQFDAEAVLEVNEFDSAFNRDPFNADPMQYEPDVYLVNGRGYNTNDGGTNRIEVLTNSTLLLHYADLGNHDRGFTVLNHRQRIMADDSHVAARPADVATKWLTAGQVSDSFVNVDSGLDEGTRIPIFESGFHLASADGSTGLGGMLAYLLVHGINGTPNGPIATVSVTGGSTMGFTGTQSLTFSGRLRSTSGPVTQAEWFLDNVSTPGTGYQFNAGACDTFSLGNGANPAFSCTLSAARLNTLLIARNPVDGDHVIWVHGANAAAGWGVVSGDVFTYNITGPETGALTVHLTPTNGLRINDIANGAAPDGSYLPSSDLVFLGTSTQSLADWIVMKGEYCIDSTACANGAGDGPLYLTPPLTTGPVGNPSYVLDPSGTACAPTVTAYGTPGPGGLPDAPGGGAVVSFCGFTSTANLGALSEGTHTAYFHAYEAPVSTAPLGGRWGSYSLAGASIQFKIDRHGPSVASIKIDPSPNNGRSSQSGNLNFLDSLQVAATLDDSTLGGSPISLGEVFVTDTGKTPLTNPELFVSGTGSEMYPDGAKWNDSATKLGWAYIPLAILNAYPEGKVRFWAHGQDQAGTWGDLTYQDMVLDRTAPLIDSPTNTNPPLSVGTCSASPNQCVVNYTAHDPVSNGVNSNVVGGEWFLAQTITRLPGDDIAPSNDPGQGNGVPFHAAAPATVVGDSFSISPADIQAYLVRINATASTLAPGTNLNIVFRVRDAAGNWSKDVLVVGRMGT